MSEARTCTVETNALSLYTRNDLCTTTGL